MEGASFNPAYPVSLRIQGKLIVVVGGGGVAERKLKGLMEGGADKVTLISPHAVPGIVELNNSGRLNYICREFVPDDLDGAFLVFAASSSPAVNLDVMNEAEKRGIWCNRADRGDEGNFITPSVLRRDELTIAVSAGGASPALASLIKGELESRFSHEAGAALRRLRALRYYAKTAIPDRELRRSVLRLAAEETLQDWSKAIHPQQWLKELLTRTEGRLDSHEE
ncbi:precorrin-2 dehydrogenase/sirohydrochlorin ferrochelatase family protein [Paenibacillus sp. CAU 1782]